MIGKVVVAVVAVAAVVILGFVACHLFGQGSSVLSLAEKRAKKIENSSQYKGGKFANTLPRMEMSMVTMIKEQFNSDAKVKIPSKDAPVEPFDIDAGSLWKASKSGLRITWLGHSTMLMQIEGYTILTDPQWSSRCSPIPFMGPKRFFDPPIALEDLPKIDAVVISHDHYDHLDKTTIMAMHSVVDTFVVPLGVGEHLEKWGVAPSKIHELDWWDDITFDELTLTATPARHFSGRGLWGQNKTLWCGWAIKSSRHNVYFSGDTGMFPGFHEIGKRLGPFDITFIESGAYNQLWSDIHLGPEQAVMAHKMVRGKIMVPVHWGLYSLAMHNWTEPVERVLDFAHKQKVTVALPKVGQPFELADVPHFSKWWPEVPWESADSAPVVSTGLDATIYEGVKTE